MSYAPGLSLSPYMIIFAIMIFAASPAAYGNDSSGNTIPGDTNYPYEFRVSAKIDISQTSGTLLYGPHNGFVYFVGKTTPARIVKIRLLDFTVAGELTLNPGEDHIGTGVIDPLTGNAYFGTNTTSGTLVKVKLSDMTRVGALPLHSGEDHLVSSVIDPEDGHAYFGTGTAPGRIVKIKLSDFSRVGGITLESGEDNLVCGVIDPGRGYAYFGADESTTKTVIRVDLLNFTRDGTLPLWAMQWYCLRNAFIDSTLDCAVFSGDYGNIVRVRLSDFTVRDDYLAASPPSSWQYSSGAVLDPLKGYYYRTTAYGGMRGTTGTIGDLFRTPRSDLAVAESGEYLYSNYFYSAVYNPVIDAPERYLYGVFDQLSRLGDAATTRALARVNLAMNGSIHANRVHPVVREAVRNVYFYNHEAGGHVRLAIYDNLSPKNLIWQSAPIDLATSNTWTVAPISGGTPASVTINAGYYWLAWQTDSKADAPSCHATYAGSSSCSNEINFPYPYGSYPATIAPDPTYNATMAWGIYWDYDPVSLWVEFPYAGTETGTYSQPFNTLAEAILAAPVSGSIMIKPGQTSETIRITKPMRIESFNGAARIGAP